MRRPIIAAFIASAAAAVIPIAAHADSSPAFSCTDQSGGSASSTGVLSAVRIARHLGYDRITFQFTDQSGRVPAYRIIRQPSSHFHKDPSDRPLTLEGSAGLRVAFQGVDQASGVPADLRPRLAAIREAAKLGDFERVTSWGVGLSLPACIRAIELTAPPRLSIDVQTGPSDAATPPSNATHMTASGSTAASSTTAGDPATVAQPVRLAQTGQPPAQTPAVPLLPLVALAGGAAVIAAGLRFGRR